MKLSTRQVRYVCEVARLGSIKAASSSLRISQSSLLAAITVAESNLDARIFDRQPARGVTITPAGERFVTAARALLAANDEFGRQLGDLAKSTPQILKVACFAPFGSCFIADVLKVFVDTYGPTEIVLYEGDQSQLREWLANGSVDLVITYDIGPSFGDNRVTPICKVPAHAILPANDPLARKKVVRIADLAQRPLVLLDLPQTSIYLMTLFDVLATKPAVKLRTRSYDTVRSAVSAGFGVAILNMRPSRHSVPDTPGVVRRPLADSFSPPTLIVADLYGPNKPAFVRAMIQTIRDFFRDLGPEGFAVTTKNRAKTLFDV